MKIFTAAQMRELDKYTMEHEPVKPLSLMERAAEAMCAAVERRWGTDVRIFAMAGPGNNGGDALAMARLLSERGYTVAAYLFNVKGELSPECQANRELLVKGGKAAFTEVSVDFTPPELEEADVVIDGLFGSGLDKPLTGGFASLARYLNYSKAAVVSIDIPSGLFSEDNTGNAMQNVVKADVTLAIDRKRLAMMLADCAPYCGEVEVVDIGLSKEFDTMADWQFATVEKHHVAPLLPPRGDFAHKGDMGKALIVAGSYGMAGAAILAAAACLRSGAGKVAVRTPKANVAPLQVSVPEAVLLPDVDQDRFTKPVDCGGYGALAIGPGIGCDEQTAIAMITQVRGAACPVVADADALNIIGSHRAWMQQLPKGIILTPHAGELERLFNNGSSGCYDSLSKAMSLAQSHGAYVLLKGRHSALCRPDGKVLLNTTGNSGMATAGSGDVLTGMIAAFLARGCEPGDAAVLGMYLHGLAGDIAAEALGKESLTAGDIVECLPKAFKAMWRQ